jgi:apolipoprotein N-acyltransferase
MEAEMNANQVTYPQKDRWSYLWLAIATLMGFLWTVPLVMWLSPIFMLRFMRSQKVWRGFLLAWLTSFVTIAIGFREALPLPIEIFIPTMLITSLVGGALPLLADRLLVPRLRGFAATLVFPLAVTALDFIGAITNPLGSVGAQGYSQYGNLALMQLISVTGMWGIVFLVNWLGSVVNWAWERSFEWKEIRRGALLYVGVMLLVVSFGSIRLAFAPEPTATVRIHGLTAVDHRQGWDELQWAKANDWQAFIEMSAENQDLYFEGTIREARAGAQVVHWPEMAVMISSEQIEAFIEHAKSIAHEEGIYLAMGVGIDYPDGSQKWENKLIVIDPTGEIVLDHDKYGNYADEGFKPGDGVLRTFETPFGVFSGLVCNDTNHQEVVAQAGRNGTQVLFSPSFEYRGIDPIHAHMAAYRAVENGITLVRQADNGLSIVVDPYGRMVASTDHFIPGERVMAAQVPIYATNFTLYSYAPDLFGWLSIIGFAAITIVAVVQGRKAKQAVVAQPEPQAAS